ncbi:MFS transporter [Noviherbaspirillum massiliense]|uniref:MFS transporter n=1 Tax=Noviherbaspirillum massiliense TaxID=1465823 RepID=UPI0002FFE8E3|nr:MFS transporter [Noviherbaspirillum massiliense]
MSRYHPREWLPHEKPALPGSPSTPHHPTARRLAYAAVGFIVAITGGLGNALVSANLQNIQGALGVYQAEAAWLTAAYVMTNATANLLIVKFRQQYGLRLFTELFLGLYALVTFAHLFVNDLSSAVAVRAAHGMAAAALAPLGLYYMQQAFPKEQRLRGIALGLGASQLALPLSRIISPDVLRVGEWRGLYLFELGMALLALGCVLLLKLPPSDRIKAFEKLDFLTFALFAPGAALLCAVLSLGRIDWWLEAPWIGIALACAIVLLVAAIALEHNRRNPLLNTRWLSSGKIVRLGLSITLIRIALSEQAVGAVGFLQALGLTNDQLHGLFTVVLLGLLVGMVTSALTLNPKHLPEPVLISLIAIIVGALIDAQATNLTRPGNMYISQFLIGFGSTFFLGPAMVFGISGVITQPRNLVSFAVLFNMSQNIGGLIGSALLGTFQTVREKFHSSQLVENLTLLDPQVAARVQSGASAFARAIPDPALRSQQGLSALSAAATREANVLAYNDVFLLIAGLALLTFLWLFIRITWLRLSNPQVVPGEQPAAAAVSATSTSEEKEDA